MALRMVGGKDEACVGGIEVGSAAGPWMVEDLLS